jgi:hypothetical protein
VALDYGAVPTRVADVRQNANLVSVNMDYS